LCKKKQHTQTEQKAESKQFAETHSAHFTDHKNQIRLYAETQGQVKEWLIFDIGAP